MLSYNAPKCCTEPITLAGLSVTDNGFGVWNVTFPVAGGDCDGNGNSSSPPAGVSAKGSKRVSHWLLSSSSGCWIPRLLGQCGVEFVYRYVSFNDNMYCCLPFQRLVCSLIFTEKIGQTERHVLSSGIEIIHKLALPGYLRCIIDHGREGNWSTLEHTHSPRSWLKFTTRREKS